MSAKPNDDLQRYAVWPDGTICEADQLWEMGFMSDDFTIVEAESEEDALAKAEKQGYC